MSTISFDGPILWYRAIRIGMEARGETLPVALQAAREWRVALALLGHNLAAAGALCAAFKRGLMFCDAAAIGMESRSWWPGCGRPVPGWEPGIALDRKGAGE